MLSLNRSDTRSPTTGVGLCLRVSRVPHSHQEIIDEFLQDIDLKNRLKKVRRKEASLSNWINPISNSELRPEVKFLLSDDFKSAGDGFKRGMFILANELKRIYGEGQALIILNDWNVRMGNPVNDKELSYRMNTKIYTLSTDGIKSFLKSLGHTNISTKCNHKI